MKKDNCVKETLVTAKQIKERVAEIAKQISADYKGKRPLLVGILKGAWVYLADLARAVECDVEINFMSVSSYGNSTVTSGSVTIMKDISVSCKGRHVIIVEDIVDTGITMARLRELFMGRGAASVAATTIVSKPSRRLVDVTVEYVGFEIPDNFVIGYGMDYAEKYRGLEDICVFDESCLE